MRYTVTRAYTSGSGGPWRAGDVVEIDDDLAAHLEADSPGLLVPVADEPEPEARTFDAPPHDRQVKAARKR